MSEEEKRNFFNSLCFSHPIAKTIEGWEWPENEFYLWRPYVVEVDPADGVPRHLSAYHLYYEEIKRRSDWFLKFRPELCHHANQPWRWSGHPGKEYKMLTDESVCRDEINRANAALEELMKDPNFKPRTQWSKGVGKQNEQFLHSAMERMVQRVAGTTGLITINPVRPYFYAEDNVTRIPNPEFGSCIEEWRKVPLHDSLILGVISKLPGVVAVARVAEAHPMDTAKGKLAKAPAYKPAPQQGDVIGLLESDPKQAAKKRKAAARKKAAASVVDFYSVDKMTPEEQIAFYKKLTRKFINRQADKDLAQGDNGKPKSPTGVIPPEL